MRSCPLRLRGLCLGLCLCAARAHAQPPPEAAAPPAPAKAPVLEPPVVIERVAAAYPPAELAAHQEANVLLAAQVDVAGSVVGVKVIESGGPSFDEAAMAALRTWRFQPARQDGVPIKSVARVPFRFALSSHAHEAEPPAQPPPEHHFAAPDESPEPPELLTVPAEPTRYQTISRTRVPPPPRATSDFVLDRAVINAAPHQSAGDLLGAAPGVYIARPEGDAVAHQVFLRGFDAQHGQDIEFSVGAVPVNQIGHIHGQGYADLNFIIPETVRTLRVTEGVFDPRQGDFAVAGSVNFDLGVADRGFHSHTTYGSFNTFRQLALWAPRGQPEETFGAVSIRRSDGYGQNRGSMSGVAMAQYAFGSGPVRGVIHASAYGARAGLAGVLRLDDIQGGRVGFYDAYPNPSATAQSAFAARAQVSMNLEHRSGAGARTGFGVWVVYHDFRERVNFTGFRQRSQLRPEWVGRGDLIEQGNRDFGLGARAFHKSRRFEAAPWLSGTFEGGLDLRLDLIDQEQNLLQAPQNETWDRRVDASLRAADVGAYGDIDWKVSRYLHLRGGVRADLLFYDADDRLGNFIPSFMRETHLVGFRRTALGVVAGPRATVEVVPLPWLTMTAAYGEGYRSPQPRQLEEGENAPFAKVRSFEVGLELRLFSERLRLRGAGYATLLSNDLAFDPSEARLERIGPTTRLGAVVHGLVRPWPWALLSVSATYVRATLDAPPPATAENPAPSFSAGQLLPYVPPLVVRADLGLDRQLFKLGGYELGGRFGAGFTFLSQRPLPYGQFADPLALLDLSAGLRYRFAELGFEVFNVLDSRVAAVEFSFVSDWGTKSVPSLVPARHIAAGAPRTFMGTVGFHF